jgi:HPt (histidine-containing phosphotransfer) domain-containing protein
MDKLEYIQPKKVAEVVGEENVIEMLNNYRNSLVESLQDLEEGWNTKDRVRIRMTAHKIKSSTRLIGANQLANYFQQLESLAKEQSLILHDKPQIMKDIIESANLLEEEIMHYIG